MCAGVTSLLLGSACALGFDEDGDQGAAEDQTSGDDGGTSTTGESSDSTTSGSDDETGDNDAGDTTSSGEGGNLDCGPATATVTKVLDGDTIEIDGGTRVRYILVDTPEFGTVNDCYAEEAKDFNNTLVYGKTINLTYDQECRDQYDRLLAFVSVSGQNVNRLLVSEGYACVLHFSPNGDAQVVEYYTLLNEAFMQNKGMWAVCEEPC